jgi:hypothetical protein
MTIPGYLKAVAGPLGTSFRDLLPIKAADMQVASLDIVELR